MTSRDMETTSLIYEAIELPGGDRLAWCLDSRGDSTIWLVRDLCADCEEAAENGNADRFSAPHEQGGQLSDLWRRRVQLITRMATLPRCGRPTRTTGAPCRSPVHRPGDSCGRH